MVSKEMKQWCKAMVPTTERQIKDDHVPTPGELNNITYLSMKYLAGWPMRTTDLGVVLLMSTPKTLQELDKHFVPVLAEYIWDHLMGEPDKPTLDDMKYGCRAIIKQFYTQDEHTRNSTDSVSGGENG